MKDCIWILLVAMGAVLAYTALRQRGLGWALYSELVLLLVFWAMRFLLGLIRGPGGREGKREDESRPISCEPEMENSCRQEPPCVGPEVEGSDGLEGVEALADGWGTLEEDDEGWEQSEGGEPSAEPEDKGIFEE